MSTPVAEQRRLAPGLGQLGLRAGILLGTAVALASAAAVGAAPPTWVPWAVMLLALVLAARPDSVAGVAVLVGSAYTWLSAPESHTPLVLLAAAALVVVHVCALLAAQGPLLAQPDATQVRRWAARGVLLWLAAVVVWGLDALLDGVPGGRWVYAAGLVALAGLAVATTRTIGQRRP